MPFACFQIYSNAACKFRQDTYLTPVLQSSWFQAPLAAVLSVLTAISSTHSPGWGRPKRMVHFSHPKEEARNLPLWEPTSQAMQKAATCFLEKLKSPVKERKGNLPWTPRKIICLLGRRQHISFGKSLVTKKPCYFRLADDFLKFNQIQ